MELPDHAFPAGFCLSEYLMSDHPQPLAGGRRAGHVRRPAGRRRTRHRRERPSGGAGGRDRPHCCPTAGRPEPAMVPAADRRERVDLPDDLERLVEPAPGDQAQIFPRVGVDRTVGLAGGKWTRHRSASSSTVELLCYTSVVPRIRSTSRSRWRRDGWSMTRWRHPRRPTCGRRSSMCVWPYCAARSRSTGR